jgi:hypothetical protein
MAFLTPAKCWLRQLALAEMQVLGSWKCLCALLMLFPFTFMFSLRAKLNLAKCSIEKRVKYAPHKNKREPSSVHHGSATGRDGNFRERP